MSIDQANVINLTGLWKRYGTRVIDGNTPKVMRVNISWPHRCWLDMSESSLGPLTENGNINIGWLDRVPGMAIVPVWPLQGDESGRQRPEEAFLLERRWRCVIEQLAMYKEIARDISTFRSPRSGFKVTCARTMEEVKVWVDIGSDAFGYQIDHVIIERILFDKSIRVLIAWQNDEPVASALLYKTGDVVGVHQVAVKSAYQGRGVANEFMLEIGTMCAAWNGQYMVLQASQAGQPLYEKLGFIPQFKIKYYQRA